MLSTNLVQDSLFNQSQNTLNSNWGTSSFTEADKGWFSDKNSKWIKNVTQQYAKTDNTGAGGLTQVIKNDSFTKGTQFISFDGINCGVGNTLRLQVYGVNGEFKMSSWNRKDPVSHGTQPITFSSLLDTGNVATKEFDWTNFAKEVNFGSGYQYIAVRFTTNGVADTEFMAIDNFMITNDLPAIPVNKNNNFPSAGDDSITTNKNVSVNINVLGNDSDPEGDIFTIDSFTQPVNGTVTLNQDGTFNYSLVSNLTGQDSFTYTIIDAKGAKDTANVNVTAKTPSFEIGTNLHGIVDWSRQLPFIDGFKFSRNWTTQNETTWNTNESALLDLDENGWVKSLPTSGTQFTKVATVLFNGGYEKGGQYVVNYEGEGKINYGLDAKLVSSKPGRDVIQVNPSNLVYISITATDPNKTGNYLKNISVVPLEQENTYKTDVFNPDFMNHIDSFNTIRFMDWMSTNNSTQSQWNQRPTINNNTWTKQGGVPVEIMVDLSNRLNSDPWFTMPHQATDDYVRNFATYVRDHLEPTQKVYVEYSNEVWNWQFQQTQWVDQQAKESGLQNGIDWYSKRTTEITQIWDDVFGQDKERVIGVMGAQAANTWTANRSLNYNWTDNPLSHDQYGIDAIGIAPYFGHYIGNKDNKDTLLSWTQEADGGLNKLFDEITKGGLVPNSPTGGALQQSYQWMNNYFQLAKQEGLNLVAYEGGQHLVDSTHTPAIVDLFAHANRDPRMGKIYQEYLKTWFNMGGDEFVNFSDVGSYSKWGDWGLTEKLNQSSPKYDAVMGLINSNSQ